MMKPKMKLTLLVAALIISIPITSSGLGASEPTSYSPSPQQDTANPSTSARTLPVADHHPASGKKVSVSARNDPKGPSIKAITAQAERVDPSGFAKRLRTLESSPEFTSFLTINAGSPSKGGIRGLAAILTQKQAEDFVALLKGKSLNVVQGDDGNPAVLVSDAPVRKDSSGTDLKDGPLISNAIALNATAPRGSSVQEIGWGYSCWQSAFAQAGYAAATGAICGAVGAFSFGIGWATCFGFGVFGGGINWDAAC